MKHVIFVILVFFSFGCDLSLEPSHETKESPLPMVTYHAHVRVFDSVSLKPLDSAWCKFPGTGNILRYPSYVNSDRYGNISLSMRSRSPESEIIMNRTFGRSGYKSKDLDVSYQKDKSDPMQPVYLSPK